ncbi:sensor histidine kinase [Streptomyces sp. NPDC047097]|uniref:sensor histidine kinase n=1 Tax=Streptomyces sp. NPDC047097 TaxID=3155260 RepID=UPI0033D76496
MRKGPLRPLAADALVATALTGVAVLLGQESTAQRWPPLDAAGYLLLALANLPAVARSRAPVAVCLVVHAVWACYVTLGYWPVVNASASMLAIYTVAALRPLRTAALCAVLMSGVWIYAGAIDGRSGMVAVLAQAAGFPLVLIHFGHLTRRSAELARRLAEEQRERALRAVAEERGRIARELHDVVAHHMSVISVQAGLARFVFDSDPGTARGALAHVAGTSQEALEEMRRVLKVLRADEESAPAGPMPGLHRLGDMVDRVRAGGQPVTLEVDGEERPLPPGVDLCAYRVVQEALTNAVKHAPGAATRVHLRYGRDHVAVAVLDDGRRVLSDKPADSGGHGLIGMRERAKLYGGTISTGPRSDGGWAVRLTLPTSARTAPTGDGTTE